MITRYTLPEQFSSRATLQISPQKLPNQEMWLSHWVELHPSKLLPAYAIQSILDMGTELKDTPNKLLPKLYCSEPDPQTALQYLETTGIYAPKDLVFSSPLIVQESIAGESIASLISLAHTRGWTELPVPFALGVLISIARGLEYLHALGFIHGALSSDAILIRYVSQTPESRLNQLNHSGGVVLDHWITGQLFQLTPQANAYGRGPAADCRALLWTFLEMLGGDTTVRVEGHLRSPLGDQRSSEADLSPKTKAALSQLSPQFAQWVVQSLLSPPSNMGQMLGQLQRVLDPNQAAFDPKGISRWLTRLVPERAQQWDKILNTGETQALPHLVQPGGILTIHKLEEASPVASSTSSVLEMSASSIESKSTQTHDIDRLESTAKKPTDDPTNDHLDGETKASRHVTPKPSKSTKFEGSFLERLDQKLDEVESQLQARFTPDKKMKAKLKVAIIWLDTVRSVQEFDLTKPISVGSSKDSMVKLPVDFDGDNFTLFTPSSGHMLVHANPTTHGWLCSHEEATKQGWSTLEDPSMTKISLGGKGLIQLGEFGLFFQLQMVEPPPPQWVPKLPIPSGDASLFWCFAFAAGLHLALLIMAYSSKSYTFRERGIITTSKFVEVLTKKIEAQLEEEEEIEEVEEATEVIEETYEPEPARELPRVRQEVREIAQKRFGKGKAAVNALADFLSGKADSTEGKLALGDVSAALGTSADSGLSLGSAFGEAGGQLTLGGGGGSLNTSGGLKGSRQIGKLKAKRVKRKIARVKTLKSRTRVSGGNLSKEKVIAVIRKNLRKINACYERQLIKSPNLSGNLTISWVIKPSGKVSGVKQVLSSINNAALKSCVLKIFKKLRFPKPKGGQVKVKYPLLFQQG
jgi:outer membrane biosynthesis protein TonB